eukprot:1140434-Pelagomonas_calceolata.AAC.1
MSAWQQSTSTCLHQAYLRMPAPLQLLSVHRYLQVLAQIFPIVLLHPCLPPTEQILVLVYADNFKASSSMHVF